MKKYDINFILSPLIAEESLAEETQKIRTIIESAGATIFDSEMPKLRPLMYPVAKTVAGKKSTYEQGQFGWFKVEVEPEKIPEIKNQISILPQIIRLTISYAYVDTRPKRVGYTQEGIPVVEELKPEFEEKKIEEKVMIEVEEKPVATPVVEPVKTISDEELDKQIDNLLS